MKQFIAFTLFILSFSFIACGGDDKEYDDSGYTYRTIEYQITNKTDKEYSILFYSYKYKNDKDENDFESLHLKPNEQTKILKTKYKYVRILCTYKIDLGEGMKPSSGAKFYPSVYTFFELKEGEANLIELK